MNTMAFAYDISFDNTSEGGHLSPLLLKKEPPSMASKFDITLICSKVPRSLGMLDINSFNVLLESETLSSDD